MRLFQEELRLPLVRTGPAKSSSGKAVRQGGLALAKPPFPSLGWYGQAKNVIIS